MAVTVSPATGELDALDATVKLLADVRDQNGNAMKGAAVTWPSGDASVATDAPRAYGLANATGTSPQDIQEKEPR